MNCPQCKTELAASVIDDVEIDECGTCRGVWLDRGELRQAKDLSDPNLVWMDFDIWRHTDRFAAREDPLACPRCDAALRKVAYGDTGVEVDVCTTCRGTWLEALELERIVLALKDELAAKTAPELLAASLQQAAQLVARKESLVSEWKDLVQVLKLLRLRLRLAGL